MNQLKVCQLPRATPCRSACRLDSSLSEFNCQSSKPNKIVARSCGSLALRAVRAFHAKPLAHTSAAAVTFRSPACDCSDSLWSSRSVISSTTLQRPCQKRFVNSFRSRGECNCTLARYDENSSSLTLVFHHRLEPAL